MAAQRSLPGIKPACRAGGARVSAGMVGKIVRPACRVRWAAGVRPRLSRLHRSILRPDARAGGAGGGATVAAGHKTGLPRGRGAGIRRNGRQNRQAGLPRAVGGWGAAPASVPAPLAFAACRAGGARVSAGMVGKIVRRPDARGSAAGVRPRLSRLHRSILRPDARAGGAGDGSTVAAGHKTGLPRGGRRGRGPGFRACIVRFCGPTRAREGRVAAQRSLPGIKPACRAGGARVSGGMVGKIVRPAR